MVLAQCLFGVAFAGAFFLYFWIGWKIGERLGRFWDPGSYWCREGRRTPPLTPLALLMYPTHVAYWLAADSRIPFQQVAAPKNAGDWGLGVPFDVRCCLYERYEGHPYDLQIPNWKTGDYLVGTFVVHHSILWGPYLLAALARWPLVPVIYLWYVARRRSILAAIEAA